MGEENLMATLLEPRTEAQQQVEDTSLNAERSDLGYAHGGVPC
jgi:hypothetical protein